VKNFCSATPLPLPRVQSTQDLVACVALGWLRWPQNVAELQGNVTQADRLGRRKHQCGLDNITKFANIARPRASVTTPLPRRRLVLLCRAHLMEPIFFSYCSKRFCNITVSVLADTGVMRIRVCITASFLLPYAWPKSRRNSDVVNANSK
jgi:hypothetical protein